MASNAELDYLILKVTSMVEKWRLTPEQVTTLVLAIYNTSAKINRPG